MAMRRDGIDGATKLGRQRQWQVQSSVLVLDNNGVGKEPRAAKGQIDGWRVRAGQERENVCRPVWILCVCAYIMNGGACDVWLLT